MLSGLENSGACGAAGGFFPLCARLKYFLSGRAARLMGQTPPPGGVAAFFWLGFFLGVAGGGASGWAAGASSLLDSGLVVVVAAGVGVGDENM